MARHPDLQREAIEALANDGTLAKLPRFLGTVAREEIERVDGPLAIEEIVVMSDNPVRLTGAPRRRVSFTVEGDPVPKGRPRVFKGHAVTPKRTVEYEIQIGYVWVADLGRPPLFEGPVGVTIHVRERIYPSDLDNYIKVCLDALNELAWEDDKQVESVTASIERRSKRPGIDVEIVSLEEVIR